MKYLKLATHENLGAYLNANGQRKERHITFLYFGEEQADKQIIVDELKDVENEANNRDYFILSNPREVMLGPEKNIPGIAYSIDYDGFDAARKRIIERHGEAVAKNNFPDWLPHVSYLSMKQVRNMGLETIRVKGIMANDDTWGAFLI